MEIIPKKTTSNSVKIAIAFLVSGITLFIFSIFVGSQIVCVFGLGLIFWGGLFLLITPVKFVEGSFVITETLPAYMTMDRMFNEFNSKNEAYNIPPFPRNSYLPQHLEGLKEMVTFIPAEETSGIVEIEDIAKGKFIIEKPKGLLITSPGKGLVEKIEQKRDADFAKLSFEELGDTMPALLNEFCLAEKITMDTNENDVKIQIYGSLYKDLYNPKYNLKSINLLGCPLVNAAGCVIAKSTGKLTMIQEIKTSPDGKATTVTFRIINKSFEKRQKLLNNYGKIPLRRNELVRIINSSIDIVDFIFDLLLGLQKKRINWQLLETFSKRFGETLSFTGETIPSLNLNFLKILSAIACHSPIQTSKEAYDILKIVYDYFDSLSFDDDIKESTPNFLSTKAIILSYYTLNDILLGKTGGDKENKKEILQLENFLQILANEGIFKSNSETLFASINKLNPENDLENLIDNTRNIFKEELTSFLTYNQ